MASASFKDGWENVLSDDFEFDLPIINVIKSLRKLEDLLEHIKHGEPRTGRSVRGLFLKLKLLAAYTIPRERQWISILPYLRGDKFGNTESAPMRRFGRFPVTLPPRQK